MIPLATPREQLADLLKQARIAAGYGTHGALAKKLNVSRSLVTKAESATQPIPSDALLTAWAGTTGVPVDRLTELARSARSGTPEWFMPYKHAEAEAQTLRCWSPVQVPGLLQTESYARAVFAVEPYTPEQLSDLVIARMGRKAVLGRAYVTAIIDQHVLERQLGSPAIMAEQCAYLASMAERSDIALHVLPHNVNMGLWGGFDLATLDSSNTVCLTAIEDIPSTTGNLVAKITRAFERMLGAALPCAESLKLILAAEEKWKTLT